MTDLPLISIVIGAYNAENAILETLNSIANQDYQNIETIVVNDCSTDFTGAQLEEFANKHPNHRLKIVTNNKNLGLTKSLNIGLKEAKGEYVARIDAGDTMTPNRISIQALVLIEHPELNLVSSLVNYVDDQYQMICPQLKVDMNKLTRKFYELKTNTPVNINKMVHVSVMYRKDSVLSLGAYDENYRWGQDGNLWVRMIKAGQKFHQIEEYLTNVTIDHFGITARRTGRKIDSMNEVYASLCISNNNYERFLFYLNKTRLLKTKIYLLLKYMHYVIYKSRF